jgi:hypothetical protein
LLTRAALIGARALLRRRRRRVPFAVADQFDAELGDGGEGIRTGEDASYGTSFTFGDESRTDPHLKAEGIANFDFTVVKETQLTERFKLEFRAEFFNLFNRLQFADPGTSLGTPQFGVVTSTMNLPRLVQLGLRLSF